MYFLFCSTPGGQEQVAGKEEKWHMSGESINYWACRTHNKHTVALKMSSTASEAIGVRTAAAKAEKLARLTPTMIVLLLAV